MHLNKRRLRLCLIQCQSKVTSKSQSIIRHRYMYIPRGSKDWIYVTPNFNIWATYFLCLSLTYSIPVGIPVIIGDQCPWHFERDDSKG